MIKNLKFLCGFRIKHIKKQRIFKKTIDKQNNAWYTDTTSKGVYFFVQFLWWDKHSIKIANNPAEMEQREAGSAIEQQTGGAEMRVKITLACTECKQRNYNTMKNKKNDPDRIELTKHCKFCRKHTLHKETK